jgi:hypothetical protein
MREIGILYTPENIRAIAEKRKTQTRRMQALEEINKIPGYWHFDGWEEDNIIFASNATDGIWKAIRSSYQVGDILYVKEAYHHGIEWDDCSPGEVDPLCGGNDLWYAANGPPPTDGWGKLRSPLYMPKWAARPELKRRVTAVKVERVQDISEEDAKAEGAKPQNVPHRNPETGEIRDIGLYYPGFMALWNSINLKPKTIHRKKVITHYISYPWQDIQETRKLRGKPWHVCGNPYVFAYTFEEIER